jgi:hypothetical protein
LSSCRSARRAGGRVAGSDSRSHRCAAPCLDRASRESAAQTRGGALPPPPRAMATYEDATQSPRNLSFAAPS